MNSNFDELTLFLENDSNIYIVDVIVLTETWHDSNYCVYVIDGYKLYYSTIKRNRNSDCFLKKKILRRLFRV